MNIEKKIKLLLAAAVLFFLALSAFGFLYSKGCLLTGILGFCFLLLVLMILESYLRVQHNIDRKNSALENLAKRPSASIKLEDSITVFKNNVASLLQKLLEKMEVETNKMDSKLEKTQKDYETLSKELVDRVERIQQRSEDISGSLILNEQKQIKEAIFKVEAAINKFLENEQKNISAKIEDNNKNFDEKLEKLRIFLDNRLDNDKIVQKKLSSAVEELIGKVSDLSQNFFTFKK